MSSKADSSLSAKVSKAVAGLSSGALDQATSTSSGSGGQLPSAETIACLSRLFDLNFKLYNKLHVMRRVQQSMVKLGVNTLEALESKLQSSRENRNAVFNDVVAYDTSFFRDQREFEFFKSSVAPQILRRSIARRQPGRIWVCGCSSGQEVYSMAMVLCEVMDASDELRNAQVRIFATDVNEELLKAARLGEYSSPRVDAERLSRFFTSSSSKDLRASQRLRNMVMFGKHDVLRQTPYMNIDLLACRNISHMLTPEGRGYLFATAHEALQDSGSDTGFLWLGTGEAVQKPATEAFQRIDNDAGFWRAINLSTPARAAIFGDAREAQLRMAAGHAAEAADGKTPSQGGGTDGKGGADGKIGAPMAFDQDGFSYAGGLPWANPVLGTLAQHSPYLLLDDDNKVLQSAGDMRPFSKSGSDSLCCAQLVGDLLLPELVASIVPLVRAARETLEPSVRRRLVYKISKDQQKAAKAAALAATREAVRAESESMAAGAASTPGRSGMLGTPLKRRGVGGAALAGASSPLASPFRTPQKASAATVLAKREQAAAVAAAELAARTASLGRRAVAITARPVLDHSGALEAGTFGAGGGASSCRGPKILVVFETVPVSARGEQPLLSAHGQMEGGPSLTHLLKIAGLFVATGCAGQLAGEQLRFVGAALGIFLVAVFLEAFPNPLRVKSLTRVAHELERKESAGVSIIQALNSSLEKKAAELANIERDCSDLLRTNSQVKAKLRTVSSELLSSNEELSIVNSEYVERIEELRDVNLDIENLLASTKIGVVFLDETLSIRNFTTAMTGMVPLTQQDVGRKVHVFNFDFGDEFIEVCEQVLSSTLSRHVEVLREVTHEDKAYLMRVLPYESGTGKKMKGVVATFLDISDRVLQKRDYERLIETANAPIFGSDIHGEVNEWNQKAAEITGYSLAEVMGRNLVEDYITPEYRIAVKSVLDKALLGEEVANFEFPLITSSGKRVEVLLNATSRRNAAGDIIGVVGIGQDITGRKETESKLDLVAKDLTNLIDTANAPIFGIDQKGRVNEWNRKAVEITEFTMEEVMGRNLVQEFITAEYRTAVKGVLDDALSGKATGNFEFPLYTKSGRRLQVLLNANPRRDTTNDIVGVVGVGQDITERIAQEQEYVRLIDTANAPIFGIDSNGNVNVWNKMAVSITKYSTSDVMGHNLVNEFITPDYRVAVKSVFDKALAGEEAANFEFPLITKLGTRVEVLLNATSRRDARGDVIGVVGIGQDITGRKETESKLDLVAKDLTNLIDTANAPIFGIDQLGRVNEWNQKAAEITEYPKDEVMGRNLVQEFITADFRTAVKAVLDSALFGKATGNFEFPLYTKSGRRLQVLLNANPRRDTTNEIVGVVGVGQDITERIVQEQEYVRLIDTANAPIFGIDREGNVNVWNRKAVEITQYSSSDVMGHNLVNEFITPDYREAVREVLHKALDGEETSNFEFPLMTKLGKRIEVLLNATSRRDARDDITGVMGIGQDITQFLSQQQEYTRLIENANAPIFGVDRSGACNIWNQKIAQITGFSAADVMGRNLVAEFIRPSEKHAVTEVLDLALAGTETDSFELPLQTQGKELVTLLLNASSKMDNNGNITGVVGVGQDFTARKKMEHSKTAFLASFSHELRTPLNGLLGMLELLLEQKLQEVAHRQVTLARTCSTLLLNLINDILDLSKIEAGQLEISWQPFNLCSALEGAAQLVRMQAETRGIDLVVDIREVPQIVVGDGLRLRQVVLNLLSNAIKFTKEGTIWVRCFKETDTETHHLVRIEVEDTGVGMHASDCAKLFTLFTKISDKRVANPAGSGLGLAICKQLVTLMGGAINVTSAYGSGSKFAFSVNFRRPTDEDDQDGQDGANNQIDDALEYTDETLNALSLDTGVSGASILVAEDNPFNLEVVRTFIEMAHMKCTWAPNGQRVVDIYKENVAAFDLILMDCQMPILDGYLATAAIRDFELAESLGRIPIVGLTAFAMSGDREKCLDAGMDDYLTKPIGKAALIRTIAAHKRVSAPVTEETAGRRLEGQEDLDDRLALGDCLETSMIDATLVTRDATMMAPGCFRPGAKGAGARASTKGKAVMLAMHDDSDTGADDSDTRESATDGDTEPQASPSAAH